MRNIYVWQANINQEIPDFTLRKTLDGYEKP